MTAPQSHAYIETNLRATRGHPLGIRSCSDPEEDPFNEKGLVVESSEQSISRRHERSGQGDITFSPRYHEGRFCLAGPY
jgi:hypothetical protein